MIMNSSKKQITVTVLVVLGMAFLAGGIFALSRLIEDAKFKKEFEQIDVDGVISYIGVVSEEKKDVYFPHF